MMTTPKQDRVVRAARAALTLSALAAMLLATTGCNKLRARDQLNKGVQAYKQSHFEEAVEHFKNATDYDPNLSVARLYLATAYVAEYVPGSDDPKNLEMANGAIEQFEKVLDAERADRNVQVLATKGLASLYLNMKKFEEAKQFNKKAIQIDPKDPENYYSVAVIDWTQAYTARMDARNKLGMKTADTLTGSKDKKIQAACHDVHDLNNDKVQEGIDMLNKAISLRKDYGDAMAYMNLLYRERADIDCDDADAHTADLKTADDWVEKAKAAMLAKAKAAEKSGGIVLDQNQNQTGQQ